MGSGYGMMGVSLGHHGDIDKAGARVGLVEFQDLLGLGGNIIGSEPKFGVQLLRGARGTEPGHPNRRMGVLGPTCTQPSASTTGHGSRHLSP